MSAPFVVDSWCVATLQTLFLHAQVDPTFPMGSIVNRDDETDLGGGRAGPDPSLPSLEDDVEAEVAVVGLGGSGLTAVGELLDRGVNVVGVDAGRVAGGAAGRNGGFLLAGLADFHHVAIGKFGMERAVACYEATLTELERIFESTPEAAKRVGSLRISATEAEQLDCEAQYAAMMASGLPVDRYDGPEGTGSVLPARRDRAAL